MIKKTKYFLLLLFIKTVEAQNLPTYSINEAINKKIIDVKIKYNTESIHYIEPVIIEIKNKTNNKFKISINTGNLIEPSDTAYQNFIVTENLLVNINNGVKKTIKPKGMCTEPYDMAGNEKLSYNFIENKDYKLIKIAKFISENNYNDAIGQKALWCVADNSKSLLEIIGYDSISRIKLIKVVAEITNKPIPSINKIRETYSGYTKPDRKETIGGMFEFSFPFSTKVHIAMFNPQGTLVRELYYNENELPGVHKINFEFDYTVYTDEFYTVKLIADNKVLLSSKIDGAG